MLLLVLVACGKEPAVKTRTIETEKLIIPAQSIRTYCGEIAGCADICKNITQNCTIDCEAKWTNCLYSSCVRDCNGIDPQADPLCNKLCVIP